MAIEDEENLDESQPEEPEEPSYSGGGGWYDNLKELGKERIKRLAKEKYEKQAAKKLGKEAAKKAGTSLAKEGTKKAAQAAIGSTGIGLAVSGFIELLDRWGVIDFVFKWSVRLSLFTIFLIVFLIAFIFGSFYLYGYTGNRGSTAADAGKPANWVHYHDALADLASAGSKKDKIKLLKSNAEKIIENLNEIKDAYKSAFDDADSKKSIELIDKMIAVIRELQTEGNKVDNSDLSQKSQDEKIKIEEKNDKQKEEVIDKIYTEKWIPLWNEFKQVFPGFKSPVYVYNYIRNVLTPHKISASITGFYDDTRNPSVYRTEKGFHNGYDVAYGVNQPVYAGWAGKVNHIYPVADGQVGVSVFSADNVFEFRYTHMANIKVKPGNTVSVGTLLGYTAVESHVDIKVRRNGEWYDWGKLPIK